MNGVRGIVGQRRKEFQEYSRQTIPSLITKKQNFKLCLIEDPGLLYMS